MATEDILLFLIRHPPYERQQGAEMLDIALAAAVMGRPLEMLFLNNGLWQLLPEQQPQGLGLKPFTRGYRALPDHGEVNFYVAAEDLSKHLLDAQQLLLPATPLSAAEIRRHIAAAMHIIDL